MSHKEEWQLSTKFHGSQYRGDLDLGLVTSYDSSQKTRAADASQCSTLPGGRVGSPLAQTTNHHGYKPLVLPLTCGFPGKGLPISPRSDQLYFLIGTRHSDACKILDSERIWIMVRIVEWSGELIDWGAWLTR